MSFKVLVEDEDGTRRVVHEVADRRVTRVGFSGSQGEGGAMRVAHDQTEVLLTFEYVIQDGRPTLQDVEAMQNPTRTGEEVQAAVDELATLPTATNTGPDVMLAASDQGETSDEGGTDSEVSPSGEEASAEESPAWSFGEINAGVEDVKEGVVEDNTPEVETFESSAKEDAEEDKNEEGTPAITLGS